MMKLRVTSYSQGKYFYTLPDKDLLIMYKYYTISKQNYITLVAWVYFYLIMGNKKKWKRKRKQKGSWLNRWFCYIVRDAANTGVNAFERIGPGLMRKASW